MKNLIVLVLIVVLSSCGQHHTAHIEGSGFDSEKQALIYEILKRSVVEKKDIPDYNLINDKERIYVGKTYYSKFHGATKADIIEFQLEDKDIPDQILNVHFYLKSKEELQEIADNSSDFIYLAFGSIDIKDNIATIGIRTSWKKSKNSKVVHLSGGGYILQYKKENGKWAYEKTLSSWIS